VPSPASAREDAVRPRFLSAVAGLLLQQGLQPRALDIPDLPRRARVL
jgi:hypothetical protein